MPQCDNGIVLKNRPWVFIIEDDASTDVSSADGLMFNEDFTGPNSIQAEVYRLGLRLEEINEEIGEQIRNKRKLSQDNSQSNSSGSENSPESVFKQDQHEHFKDGEAHPIDLSRTDKTVTLQCKTGDEPGESGYYTSRTVPQLGEGGFDEKYLSRSLEVPKLEVDRSTIHSADTEDRVGSWLSRENHTGPSSRRRTRSSEISSKFNKHDSPQGLRLQTEDSNTQDRSPNQSKLSTPDTAVGKTYTMNSAEDSGFLDGELRNVNSRARAQRSMTSPVHTKFNRRYHPEPDTHSILEDNKSNLSNSPGEQYRERLDSLRNFIQNKRQSNEEKVRKTPRSWVRGRASTNASPSYQESITSSCHSPETNGETVESDHFGSSVNMSHSSRRKSREQASKSKAPPPLNHSYEESVTGIIADISDSDEHLERESLPENQMLESLQEEMHGIRDMVLDLKSSIRVNSNTHSNTNKEPSPTRQSSIKKSNSPNYKKTRNTPRQNTNRSGHDANRSPRNSNEHKHKDNSLQQQQLRMFEKLNNTMERLSGKLQDVEQQRDKKYSSSRSISSESDDFERKQPQRVSFQDKRDENFNSIDLSPTSDQSSLLKHLNKRVDSLYSNIHDTEGSRRHQLDECDNYLSKHQSKVVAHLERKINKLEKHMTPSRSLESTRLDSPHVPVYLETCLVCGGFGTHSHGSYVFKSKGTPLPVPSLSYNHHDERSSRTRNISKTRSPKTTKDVPRDARNTSVSYEEQQSSTWLTDGSNMKIHTPSVIHHYHSFSGTNNFNEGEHKQEHHGGDSRMQPMPRGSLNLSTKELESPDVLYESINGATLAAKRMESVSKRMLSTIAADLFNSRDLNEY